MANNDVENLLITFLKYVKTFENHSLTTPGGIKNSFDLAICVEKSVIELENRSILPDFTNCLNASLKSKNRTLIYNLDFFRYACDQLLLKYFATKSETLQIVVQNYTSLCSKERFKNVLKTAIHKKALHEPILKFVILNKNELNIKELESRLLLRNWELEIERGNSAQIKKAMIAMFEAYKVDKTLPILLECLILRNMKTKEIDIQYFILNEVILKMENRSKLNKEFWVTLIKNTNKILLIELCEIYDIFLITLINFIVYCVCMMDYELGDSERIWTANLNSICPEVTFSDIISIVRALLDLQSDVSLYVKSRLEDSKQELQSLVWIDVIRHCF